jgi:antitoxin (DNA-binding transcriptional repressor) of toxin-antitoxin stability system
MRSVLEKERLEARSTIGYHLVSKEDAMKMVTIREFRANTAAIWKELKPNQDLVLTNNGKPIALVKPVTEDSLEDELRMARRNRAEQAMRNMRAHAKAKGLDKLSMADINAEIAEYRREKAKRVKKAGL